MPGKDISESNNKLTSESDELSKAKSNLEQYLLISTSEGKAKEQYQEYVRNNFDRVFEGYKKEEFEVVGQIFTKHLPQRYNIAIDECVQSTLDIFDLMENVSKDKLKSYQLYLRSFNEHFENYQSNILGNELIKHYLNLENEGKPLIFGMFTKRVWDRNEFEVNNKNEGSKSDLPLSLTNYFSQDLVVNHLKNYFRYKISFEQLYDVFSDIRNSPTDKYGLNHQEILQSSVCKLLDHASVKENLENELSLLFRTYNDLSSTEGNNLSEEVNVHVRKILTQSYLNLIQPLTNITEFSKLIYAMQINFRISESETVLFGGSCFDKFNQVLQNYVKSSNFNESDYETIIKSLRTVYGNGSEKTFNDFNSLLSHINEQDNKNSLDLDYILNSIEFCKSEIHDSEDRSKQQLNDYLSRPRLIKKLNSLKRYKLELDSHKSSFSEEFYYLMKSLSKIFLISDDDKRSLPYSISQEDSEVNVKDYFVEGICDLLDLTDNHQVLIKYFNQVSEQYSSSNWKIYHSAFRHFAIFKNYLEKNYHKIDLEKDNLIENIKGYFSEFGMWDNILKLDLSPDQMKVMINTYSLIENTVFDNVNSKNKSSKDFIKRIRSYDIKKLKNSFFTYLDEVINTFEDESEEVQKNEVVNYCRKISQLVKEDKFDVLAFIDEGYQLRGVQ